DTQHLSHVDAWNFTIQRQLTDTLSGEIAYVGNAGRGFFGDNPATNVNQPSIQGFAQGVGTNLRRPFFAGLVPINDEDAQSHAFGWTQGIDSFSNTGKSRYNAFQAKITKRFSSGYSLLAHYTYQDAKNNSGDYFFIDLNVNYGPADFIRK